MLVLPLDALFARAVREERRRAVREIHPPESGVIVELHEAGAADAQAADGGEVDGLGFSRTLHSAYPLIPILNIQYPTLKSNIQVKNTTLLTLLSARNSLECGGLPRRVGGKRIGLRK